MYSLYTCALHTTHVHVYPYSLYTCLSHITHVHVQVRLWLCGHISYTCVCVCVCVYVYVCTSVCASVYLSVFYICPYLSVFVWDHFFEVFGRKVRVWRLLLQKRRAYGENATLFCGKVRVICGNVECICRNVKRTRLAARLVGNRHCTTAFSTSASRCVGCCVCWSVLQCVTVCCRALLCAQRHSLCKCRESVFTGTYKENAVAHTATHCNTLEHTATHCNTHSNQYYETLIQVCESVVIKHIHVPSVTVMQLAYKYL